MAHLRRPSLSNWIIALAVAVSVYELASDLPTVVRDTVRWACLAEAAVVVTLSAVIARRYADNYLADPTKARLLPRHIVRVSLGTIGLTLACVAVIVNLLTKEFVWYGSPIILPALTIYAFGLWDMVAWLPNRTAPPDNAFRRRDDDTPGHNEDTTRTSMAYARRDIPSITRGATTLGVVTAVFITWTLWQGEHDSCRRAVGIRTLSQTNYMLDAQRAKAIALGEHGHERAVNLHFAKLYQRLAHADRSLGCGKPIPEVGSVSAREIKSITRTAIPSSP